MGKNIFKCSIVKLVASVTLSSFIFSQCLTGFAVDSQYKVQEEIKNQVNLNEAVDNSTVPSTPDFIDTKNVLLNNIGLERVNKYREENGLDPLSESSSVKLGQEVVSPIQSSSLMASASSSLPNKIDNSALPAFPPIADQGNFGYCGSFAVTYYQMTHMVALQKGWNTKNDPDNSKKFSPKFTGNLTNGGVAISNMFGALKNSGALLWKDFPYNAYSTDPKESYEWPTTSALWRAAMNYKADKLGYVAINDWSANTPSLLTPISNEKDSDLDTIKSLLVDGYILTFTSNPGAWQYQLLKDNTTSLDDDGLANQKACFMSRGLNDGHVMTIVGYNDAVWCDINFNNIIDRGEKGAFKVANSWGSNWADGNDGFIWIMYDALNKISSAPENPNLPIFINPSDRDSAISNNRFYWLTVKNNYTPKLIAEFTINHNKKSTLDFSIGFSNSSDTNLSMPIQRFYGLGGDYSFDGTNNPSCDATIDIDLTGLNEMNFDNPNGKWFLKVTDKEADNIICTIKDFKLIDNTTGTTYTPAQNFPVTLENSIIEIPVSIARQAPSTSEWSILKCQQGGRINAAYVSDGNLVYVLGGLERTPGNPPDYCQKLDVFDSQTGLWTQKTNMINKITIYPKAFFINSKIYATGINSDGNVVIDEYNPTSNSWTNKITQSFDYSSAESVNGKIYFIGSSLVKEYDPATNILSTKNSFNLGFYDFKLASANNKIYAFESLHPVSSALTQQVMEYNPQTDTWLQKPDMPYISDSFAAISLKNKLYLFSNANEPLNYIKSDKVGEQKSYVLEYDPVLETWAKRDNFIPVNIDFSLTTLNNKILLIGNYDRYFDPNAVKLYATYEPGWIDDNLLPVSVYNHASTVCNNKIYTVEGTNSSLLPSNNIQIYDPTAKTWTVNDGTSTSRKNPSAAALLNNVYVLGGYNSSAGILSSMEMYNDSTSNWITKASMSTARRNFSTVVINDKLYALGGINSAGNVINTCEVYNPATNSWSPIANMIYARRDFAAAVVNNKIYVMGGATSSTPSSRSNKAEEYDPSTNTWTEKSTMPTSRDGLAATALNGKIYAIGGTVNVVGEVNTVEEYNPALNTWTKKSGMLSARTSLSAVTLNQNIYAIGGNQYGVIFVNSVESYAP
jgi:C1A family cysteine protease